MRPAFVRTFVACVLASSLSGCIIVELPDESSGAGTPMRFPDAPAPVDGTTHPNDTGDVALVWTRADGTEGPAPEALREDVAAWVDMLDARLALPYDVRVRHETCGTANAFYVPEEQEVVLCYELMAVIHGVMSQAGVRDAAGATGSAWLFVLFHELGHAYVDAYDLPVTGREEDAVDDLATLILIDAGASDAAVEAALFWILTERGMPGQAEFADEHSLNAQRFYAILCTVYGSDPATYGWMVEEGYLPAARAARCDEEYAKKDAAWSTLLAPWLKEAPGAPADGLDSREDAERA